MENKNSQSKVCNTIYKEQVNNVLDVIIMSKCQKYDSPFFHFLATAWFTLLRDTFCVSFCVFSVVIVIFKN